MAVDRRALWIGAILIVAIVAVMAVRSMGGGNAAVPTASAVPPRGRPVAKNDPAVALVPVDVHLTALTRARGEPANQGRNPFRFQPKAPPPPPPGAAIVRPGNESATPVRPGAPAGPPPPPPIAMKFIGLGEKADGTNIAVLSDGRTTHHGTEGQEIDGRYRILKIGNESIEISHIDGRGRQTIRLTGQ